MSRTTTKDFTNRITYAFSAQDLNGAIYSADKVRLKATITQDAFDRFIAAVTFRRHFRPYHNPMGQYRYFWAVEYEVGCDDGWKCVRFVIGANLKSERVGKGYKYGEASAFIEFNPNTFAGNNAFWEDLHFVLKYFNVESIARFDMAIDLPYPREDVRLVKDNRNYSQIITQKGVTEYLGCNDRLGRVKLYDKTKESMLCDTVTRLEITCNEGKCNIPRTFIIPKSKSPDDTIIKALCATNQFTEIMNEFSCSKRRKLLDKLSICEYHFDRSCIDAVTEYVISLITGGYDYAA